MLKKIVIYAYACWVCFSIAYALYFYINNPLTINGYQLSFILFFFFSIILLLFIRKVNLRRMIFIIPVSIIITAFYFNTYKFPELMILSIIRFFLLILILIDMMPIAVRLPSIIRTIIINIIITVFLLEAALIGVFMLTGNDMIKRHDEIVRTLPGQSINGEIMNEYGYIGHSPDIVTDKEKWLFIGDSFGFGVVDYDSNFIRLIERELGIISVNVSQPGYCPFDYYEQFNKFRYRDFNKIFIIIFTGNDISEWPIPENNWSFRNSRIVSLIMNTINAWQYNEFIENGDGFSNEHFYAIETQRALFNINTNESYWGRYTHIMEKIAETAVLESLNLCFILIPDEYSINTVLQDSIKSRLNNHDIDFTYTHNRAVNIINELNIDFIDTYNELNNIHLMGEMVYRENNTHLNETGNQIIFNAVIEHLDIETIYKKDLF